MIAKHNGSKWLTSDDRVSNLSLDETKCKCGRCGQNNMQQRIIDLFQALRERLAKPLTINSGFRCAEYNASAKVKGKPNSQHLAGKALDIKLPAGMDADQMEKEMEAIGATAIGKYKTFCHMDERLGEFRWDMRVV